MRADNPGDVMRTCGEIEDALSSMEEAWTTVIEKEFLDAEALTYQKALLMERCAETAADKRKAWVDREIRANELHDEWVQTRAKKLAYAARFEILSKRLSACQSVLKRLESDSQSPGFGRGQRNT